MEDVYLIITVLSSLGMKKRNTCTENDFAENLEILFLHSSHLFED